MCGIAGIISQSTVKDGDALVQKMADLQVHRGPDGGGTWSSDQGQVHFAHRRLSIIDLSDAGAQPMHSTDGRYVLTYNGEVYNYQALREKCETKGSTFQSHTDSEVIIEYIRHFGMDGIKDFRGMWAFALYDTQENTLILSRDPFGIKPLYIGEHEGAIYFASEIKALRCLHDHFKAPNEEIVKRFVDFSLLDLDDDTFFANIRRFPHAHSAQIKLGQSLGIKPQRYWAPPQDRLENITKEEAIEKLRTLLEQSIRRHLRSDVPLAFCLSGGLDSSSIVALAARQKEEGQALNSFTTRYPQFPEIDESRWAEKVANHCQAHAHWVEPDYEDFQRDFKKVLYHHDEPFGSTSIFAQNFIFKAIHDHGLKVSIDGQGADELLAGYHSSLYMLMSMSLKKMHLRVLLGNLIPLVLFNPRLITSGAEKLLRYFQKIWRKNAQEQQSHTKGSTGFRTDFSSFQEFLNYQLCEQSIPQLLRNGDRCSMTWSVESRVPFLDVDLVDFIIRLPDHMKIHRGTTKYIMREAMRGILPDDVIDRRDKLGFPAPEKHWMKQAFNIDVSGSFTRDWREFIVAQWRDMIRDT